jgi:hypothetical protein
VGESALEPQQEPSPVVVAPVAAEAGAGSDDAVARDEQLDRAARERAARRPAGAPPGPPATSP